MTPFVLLGCVFLLGWGFSGLYLAIARGRLLDLPGQRSSHARPTPTGGGVGVVAALVSGVVLCGLREPDWLIVVSLACTLALVGFIDDTRGLRVLPRLFAQIAAATALVIGGGVQLAFAAGSGALVVAAAAVMLVVWLVNIFNFMDGIDGLAAGHAVFMSIAAMLLLESDAGAPGQVLLCTAAATGGFLLLNWQPARLFMGDTGSLALGFVLAGAAFLTIRDGQISAAAWLILWSPMIVDTSVVLVRRAWRRERLFEAHRSHAYQRLSRAWRSHARVALYVLLVDLLWLLPLAWMAQREPAYAPVWIALALVPLLAAVTVIARRCP